MKWSPRHGYALSKRRCNERVGKCTVQYLATHHAAVVKGCGLGTPASGPPAHGRVTSGGGRQVEGKWKGLTGGGQASEQMLMVKCLVLVAGLAG